MEERQMANDVFLDTGHVVALASKRDAHHRRALALSERVSEERVQVLTTEAVLVEVGNALASAQSRQFAARYIASVRHTPTFEVVYASRDLLDRGLALYRERQDKSWSLTDCISFVVMREQGLRDALAADRDFQQAGFNALLR
jgi:predicted nucleic acid-binding protein